jgi:peptidoglycan hydrolase-like protein with peptidoglycan-binding domain
MGNVLKLYNKLSVGLFTSQTNSFPAGVPADGYFNSITKAGVKQFQLKNNLTITGSVDLRTWQIIDHDYYNLPIAIDFNPTTGSR